MSSASKRRQRQRHPDHPGLCLHFDFIGLHLAHVQFALPDHMIMDALTMFTRAGLPRRAYVTIWRISSMRGWPAYTP